MAVLTERNSPRRTPSCSSRARFSGSAAWSAAALACASASAPAAFEGFLRVGQVVREDDVAPLNLPTQIGPLGEQDFLEDGVLVLARCVGTSDRAVAPLRIQDHPCHQQDAHGGRRNELGVKIREYPEHARSIPSSHPIGPPGHL
jgi:hypothetical protein